MIQQREPEVPGICQAEDTVSGNPQDTDQENVEQLPDLKYGWDEDEKLSSAASDAAAGGYGEVALFTLNIIVGIIGSQVTYAVMPPDVYHVWYEVVRMLS